MIKKYDDDNMHKSEFMKKHCNFFLVKNVIERSTLKTHKVFATRCHRGYLEGNSVRNLMKSGDDIFENTYVCLIEQNELNLIGGSNDEIKIEEITRMSFLNYFMVL